MRIVRITAVDHAVGRRVTVAEFKRCKGPRSALEFAEAIYNTNLLREQRLELPRIEAKSPTGWVELERRGNLITQRPLHN